MVEESMKSVPGAAACSMPPPQTASVSLPAGSMVTTTSTSLAASAAEAALVTPRASALAMLAATRSKPFTAWPFLTRLPAMGSPMLPSPMKPILAIASSAWRGIRPCGPDPIPQSFAKHIPSRTTQHRLDAGAAVGTLGVRAGGSAPLTVPQTSAGASPGMHPDPRGSRRCRSRARSGPGPPRRRISRACAVPPPCRPAW